MNSAFRFKSKMRLWTELNWVHCMRWPTSPKLWLLGFHSQSWSSCGSKRKPGSSVPLCSQGLGCTKHGGPDSCELLQLFSEYLRVSRGISAFGPKRSSLNLSTVTNKNTQSGKWLRRRHEVISGTVETRGLHTLCKKAQNTFFLPVWSSIRQNLSSFRSVRITIII